MPVCCASRFRHPSRSEDTPAVTDRLTRYQRQRQRLVRTVARRAKNQQPLLGDEVLWRACVPLQALLIAIARVAAPASARPQNADRPCIWCLSRLCPLAGRWHPIELAARINGRRRNGQPVPMWRNNTLVRAEHVRFEVLWHLSPTQLRADPCDPAARHRLRLLSSMRRCIRGGTRSLLSQPHSDASDEPWPEQT